MRLEAEDSKVMVNAMNTIVFSEKRTLTSDFSPAEMLAIASTGAVAEARKYFITKYVVPLTLTRWYQQDNAEGAVAGGKTCCVRLLPDGAGLVPHLAFETAAASSLWRVNDAVLTVHEQMGQLLRSVFKACPPDLWTKHGSSLSEALVSAFGECLPTLWSEMPKDTLAQVPMIASLQRSSHTSGESVTLNILVKTRQSVKSQELLLNQAESRSSPLVVRPSKKYKKTFNMLSGQWIGTCERDDPEICDQCKAIYASPAANNVYDDPQFS